MASNIPPSQRSPTPPGRAGHAGPDVPLPSIENDMAASPSRSPSRPILTPASSPGPRTTASPSISISDVDLVPPPPREPTAGLTNLDAALQRVRIGSSEIMNMGAPAVHLPLASAAVRTPSPLLAPQHAAQQSESPRPVAEHRRRRSSSRVNMIAHNLEDEEPPQDRFHRPAFQQAFRNAKALIGNLATVLRTNTADFEPDSVILQLRQEADTLANFQCPATRVVGLVGDSGVGKSSLLNSLLDFRGLARTSNSGEACTCVVTEYRYHDADNFIVEIQAFTEQELRAQFQEMVRNFREHRNHSESMERDERRRSQELAHLARDTFSAMFPGRYSSAILISGNENAIVDTLLGWAQERDVFARSRSETRNSREECSDLLIRLTSEGAATDGPAVWPYIKKISVHLKAHILSRGLVLVDLPGLRDLNTARRTTTMRYLLRCDEIFAVCYIGRAATDEGVRDVFASARQARLSNVGIICTKADDIRAEEALRDWEGERRTEIQRLIDALRTVREELSIMRERLTELETISREDDLLEEEAAELAGLYRSVERKRAAIESRDLELQQYLITTRNNFVTTELTRKYRNTIPQNNLRVFCASNTLYWEHRDKVPRERYLPFLNLSGIIAIRKHCMSLVSESQLRIALKYIRDDIPNLTSRIQLWVQSGAGNADAEQKLAVNAALNTVEDEIRRKFHEPGSPIVTMGRMLIGEFNEAIYQRRNFVGWRRGALDAGAEWGSWHHTTYTAFCLRNGIYETPKAGYHNWNEEAMIVLVRDVTEQWERLMEQIQHRSTALMTFVDDALDSASAQLVDLPANYAGSVAPLHEALMSAQRILSGDIVDRCDQFETELFGLRTNALSGLETAFFAEGMSQAYLRAKREHGTGSWARKKNIINGRLGEEELYQTVMRRFRNEFRELADKFQRDVKAKAEAQLSLVTGILDIVRSENVSEESEREPEFRERVAAWLEGSGAELEEIRRVIDEPVEH